MTTKRRVVDAVRARGSLIIDPKTDDGVAWSPLPERVLAWDEDATTLAIQAAALLPRAPLAIVGPGIDADTFRVALDIHTVLSGSDPMALAKAGHHGPVLAVGAPPGTSSVVAALVDDGEGADAAAPRDAPGAPRMVSAMRALAESRRVPPEETIPDSPMGAYVPMGTWMEDLPARLRLLAQKCKECGKTSYPPRGACPACRGRIFQDVQLPHEARIYAATRIGRGGAPSEFALEQAQTGAYWVAVVEWPEQGVRVTARLTDVDEGAPAIGSPVRAVVRRLFDQEGRTRYGVKFAPTSTAG